ncbi:MAG: lipid-A-disaccharide synthase [Acidobacteria bacterium]|nr:MAG: lipid-A-disaccharide synthase [Acidobacteriota bacterium]
MYGAQLIDALRRRSSGQASTELRSAGQLGAAVPTPSMQLEFFGVGGERMRAAGCETVVDAKDLSVVGITEILSHLPKIWGLFHKLIAEAGRRQPDLAIVIDSPAFNWRVARQMRKRGVPVVYYVCPQFWAWRQGRVRLLRKYVTKALVIFPFEEKFYRDRGVDASFVGHPLADLPCPAVDRAAYAAQHMLDPAKTWITIMPGSRVKEVRMNLPEILNATTRLGPGYEFLLPVAPTLDRTFLQRFIGEREIHLVDEALPAMSQSRAGIIASGTATVEAAVMGLPFVMVYRVSPLTYALGRPRVKVRHFAMANLIAGEEVVPELVQDRFTAENVVNELQKIIPEGLDRARMIQKLAEVKFRLRGETSDDLHPADRAAKEVFALLPHARAGTPAPTSEG